MKKRSNHEGTFWRCKNRWYGQVSVYDEAGKAVRKPVSGKTKAEAIQAADSVRRLYSARVYEKTTLGQWLARWLGVYCKSKRTSTKDTYKSLIKNHITPGIGHLLISEIRPDDVSGLFSDLLEKLSGSTVNLVYNILSAALRQAVKAEIAYRNIMQVVDKPKVEAVNHGILSADQLRRFVTRAQKSPYCAAYLLMLCGGLRRGEALAAKWENLNLSAGSITVTETLVKTRDGYELNQPKSKQSKRSLVLPAEVIRIFQQTPRADRAGFIVSDRGQPVHPEKLWSDFRKIKIDLCLGKLTLHELRHTHSAHLLKLKIPLSDVSRRLGHSTIKTTNDIYAHIVPESSDNAAQALNGIITTEEI